MIEWSEAYAIGEDNIDRRHRELFKVINRLEKSAEPSISAIEFERALHFLDRYAQLHFSYEETCMEKYRCAAAEQNRQAHESFLQSVNAFREQHDRRGYLPELAKKVHAFCEQWITNHICKIDIQLKDVLPSPEHR